MTEAMYIPRDERARYEAEGWTVTELGCHHAEHSLLATREIPA